MTFLPNNYEKPASGSNYKKFESGDNKFRILSDAIVGYIDWQETSEGGKKPVRTKEKQTAINPAKPPKHFWAFIIWDYADEAIKILEITQATIQDAIYSLHNDENWGDPKGFDINVNKKGEKMETKYNVIPTPHKELPVDIAKAYSEANINLNALYEGNDPFETNTQSEPEKERPISSEMPGF